MSHVATRRIYARERCPFRREKPSSLRIVSTGRLASPDESECSRTNTWLELHEVVALSRARRRVTAREAVKTVPSESENPWKKEENGAYHDCDTGEEEAEKPSALYRFASPLHSARQEDLRLEARFTHASRVNYVSHTLLDAT